MAESPAWGNRATAEQKRKGWEMAVRIEKILCTVLQEVHKRQVDERWIPSPRDRRASTADTWTVKGSIAPRHLRVVPIEDQ
jgi:hypothetical protein